jgi:hypothetical protein
MTERGPLVGLVTMGNEDEQVCRQLLGQQHDFFRGVTLSHHDLDGLPSVLE